MIKFGNRKRICLCAVLAAVVGLLVAPTGALAREIFVCAHQCNLSQTPEPDGSRENPFHTLTRALNDARRGGGDTISLSSGHYGRASISGHSFRTPVTIRPMAGANVHFETMNIANSQNITFRSLKVWPTGARPQNHPLIRTTSSTQNIAFLEMELRGHKTAQNYMRWSKTDWLKYSINGIEARGPKTTIQNSTFWGLSVPIITIGNRAKVVGNTIRGFSGDGMVGLGDHSVFADNRVQDCVKIHNNHDDGFQSWSLPPGQGVITGLVLERNIILEWTGRKTDPLRCRLQGIGLFDGTYKNLIIRNNLVAVSAYHGIAVYGGDTILITHNTVVDTFGESTQFPWILISPHKNGTPSRNIIFANNLAMSYNLLPPLKDRVNPAANANLKILHPSKVFRNPRRLDFQLKATSSAKAAGRIRFAPAYDITGKPRPPSRPPDIGAYQSD